jgi:polar amino acid transport system substrate-binding protein
MRKAGAQTVEPFRRTPRAVTAALGAAAVAAAVLAAGALTAPDGRAAGPVAPAAAPAAPRAPEAPTAGPEVCEDGSDPAASLRPSGSTGPAVRRIRDRDRLVVGVDQNSFLWGYRNPATGRLEGFDIDLVEAVAEDLLGPGPDIVYKTIPTDQRVVAVQDGEVDMVVRTMTINCDRAEQVAFSTAYFLSGQQLVVPKEGGAVTGLDRSVRGRRICLARGSTAEKLLESGKFAALGARPVKVANQLDCLVRLQLGEADAVLTDNALGAGQAAQDPSVELVGRPATVEPYGIAMNLDDTDLVRRVNRVLEDYRRGGDHSAWRVSYDRWLAEMMDTDADGEPAPPRPAYDG